MSRLEPAEVVALQRNRGPLFVFEPNGRGHRFWFASLLLRAAVASERDATLVTTQSSRRLPEFDMHIGPLLPAISVEVVAGSGARSGSAELARWAWAVLRRSRRSVVVIPDGDRLSVALAGVAAFLSPASVSILWLRLPASKGKARIKRLAGWVLSRRAHLFLLGSCFGDLEEPAPRWLRVIADPALHPGPEKIEAKQAVTGRLRVLVGGVIDERKCVSSLLNALHRLPEVDVWLVGEQSLETRRALNAVPPEIADRITSIDRFVSDEELARSVEACDVVSCLLQSATGSSGLAALGIAYGKPLLGGGNATVRHLISSRSVGVVSQSLGAGDVAVALMELNRDYDRFATNVRQQRPALGSAQAFCDELLGR